MPDLRAVLERELFPFVEKPMRYIGNELHCIKKDLAAVSLHGVLCFPELYDIGMSHFGTQILYHIVNSHDSWALSRCYNPWLDAERIMRDKQIPLYCLEYFKPLKDADWLGFSIQYELQYTNIINMLDLAGIPKYSIERKETDPIIIAGGSCMGNIEPIADFLDACVIGDGEQVIVELCRVLEKYKKRNATRKELLCALTTIDGVYVPRFYPVVKNGSFVVPELTGESRQVSAAKVKILSDEYYPVNHLVPLIDVVHHRLAVEVMRGCTRGCRFCAAGFYYRPVRERTVSSILTQITDGIAATGWDETGLLSLSTADYSCFSSLIHAIEQAQHSLSFRASLPSTRVDALADADVHTLNTLSSATSFTIAPEAGSRRLRNVINKDFTEETILSTVALLLENNVQTLKLYFMIGLPTEDDGDIEAIITLVTKISNMVRAKSKRRMVHVSVSPFSPKAHTPFQWEALNSIRTLLEKGRKIKASLRSRRNVKVSYRRPEMTFLETVLARGDRRLSAVIVKAWEKGARFDGWDDQFNFETWRIAESETGVSFEPFVQEIPEEQVLPWSAVSIGISPGFLIEERKKATQGIPTEDCRNGNCTHCGICDNHQPYIIKKCDEKLFMGKAVYGEESGTSDNTNRYRYRIEYEKREPARFLSHSNIVTIIQRAIRMAGIPVAYSRGYHPHPCIAFGPPLALGIMGTAELFDIITTIPDTLDPESINRWLPEGLVIKKSGMLTVKPVSISSAMAAARYSIRPLESLSRRQIVEAVEKALHSDSLLITIMKKEKQLEIDIKPLIYNLTVQENNGTLGMEAVLSAQPSKTCRPIDLIQCLFPGKGLGDFLITRTASFQDVEGTYPP